MFYFFFSRLPTGPEIWKQTEGKVTHLFASLGTCGTVVGTSKFLRSKNPNIKVIAVQPTEGHDVPGLRNVSQLGVSKLFDASLVDDILEVDFHLAYTRALELCQNEGLPAGPSSGLIFEGALEIVRRNKKGHAIVLARVGAPIAADVPSLLAELTRRAGLAAERARLFAAAELATRERERLLAVVAHDLRNPLSVVAMYAEMVNNPRRAGIAGDPDAFQQAIATIHRTTSGMQALVEDLLDAATVHDGALKLHLGEHDAAELFAQAEQMLRPLAATRGIVLVVEEAGDGENSGARVRADAGRLSQVLSNLVGNAIKFSPPNGTVAVRWSVSGDGLTVLVSDEGEGIAPHALPHLFSAYWQGDGFDRRGAGLGLWIARAIVEGHGGAIGVESAPGEGATFRFTLPG